MLLWKTRFLEQIKCLKDSAMNESANHQIPFLCNISQRQFVGFISPLKVHLGESHHGSAHGILGVLRFSFATCVPRAPLKMFKSWAGLCQEPVPIGGHGRQGV